MRQTEPDNIELDQCGQKHELDVTEFRPGLAE